MKYPKDIMEDIYWSFDEDMETDLESFCQRLIEYNKELEVEVNLKEKALGVPELIVRFYSDMDKEEDDEDEDDETDEEKDEDDENDDSEDDDETGYMDINIKSATGSSLTIGEILFNIHRHVAPILHSADFRFFEGLRLSRHQTNPAIPLYILELGS